MDIKKYQAQHHLKVTGKLDEATKAALKADAKKGGAAGKNAFEVAKAYVNQNASSLKVSDSEVGQYMDDGVPNDINCANFVSGVLQAAGQISGRQHHNGVQGLQANLANDGNWEKVSLANAKPGDAVFFDHHTVIFAGRDEAGKPLFIGSNNVNDDGSQRVTIGHNGETPNAIYHFIGGPEVEGATAPAGQGGSGANGGGAADYSYYDSRGNDASSDAYDNSEKYRNMLLGYLASDAGQSTAAVLAELMGISLEALKAMTPKQLAAAIQKNESKIEAKEKSGALPPGTGQQLLAAASSGESFASPGGGAPVDISSSPEASVSPGSPPAVPGVAMVPAAAASSSAGIPIHA